MGELWELSAGGRERSQQHYQVPSMHRPEPQELDRVPHSVQLMLTSPLSVKNEHTDEQTKVL